MNRICRFILAATFVVCSTMSAFAGQDEKNGHAYFTQSELPNMVNFLPPPPEFESSRFAADQNQYLWGIRQRQDEERAAMAIRDANYGMQTIIMAKEQGIPRKNRIKTTITGHKVIPDITRSSLPLYLIRPSGKSLHLP